MFGRKQQDTVEPAATPAREGTKGRPTPTRKEAQAAARERAKLGMDKKTAQKLVREGRTAQAAKMREAMRTGEERYLPARDQGPVKRFVRDYIDSRLCVAEGLLPLLVLIMALSYSGNDSLRNIGSWIWSAVVVLLIVDTSWLIFRMRRALRERFPDEDLRGTTFYAVLRAMQLRFMRQPKPQVGLGGKPIVR
ncbi:MAG: DUF3043 domain-containing protein [Marmoricola sp.]